jgi:hypothetical protein
VSSIRVEKERDPALTALRTTETLSDRRYPRVITPAEIESLPRLSFARGLSTIYYLSRERDDARYYYEGITFCEADMDSFEWEQSSWDESFHCTKGMIQVGVRDGAGKEITLRINEGEHAYLPGGFWYTLEASGVESIFLWTMGPAFKTGLSPLKEINVADAPAYSKALREARYTYQDGGPNGN